MRELPISAMGIGHKNYQKPSEIRHFVTKLSSSIGMMKGEGV